LLRPPPRFLTGVYRQEWKTMGPPKENAAASSPSSLGITPMTKTEGHELLVSTKSASMRDTIRLLATTIQAVLYLIDRAVLLRDTVLKHLEDIGVPDSELSEFNKILNNLHADLPAPPTPKRTVQPKTGVPEENGRTWPEKAFTVLEAMSGQEMSASCVANEMLKRGLVDPTKTTKTMRQTVANACRDLSRFHPEVHRAEYPTAGEKKSIKYVHRYQEEKTDDSLNHNG
jgi:hypothetical protein